MVRMISLIFISLLGRASVIVAYTTSPTTTVASLQRREDPPATAAIPTFTFNPLSQHLASRNPSQEPTGDKLQIYPTGIYDDFPTDGVTISFGPDLRKRITDAIGNDCAANHEACRNRLLPVLGNTDINTHSKRFLVALGALMGYLLNLVAAEILVLSVESAVLASGEIPDQKYDYSELAQLHDYLASTHGLGSPDTVAIQLGPDAKLSTITIPPTSIASTPTPTGPDLITLETLTADAGERKKGDIVYHVPVDSGRRIADFLGMLGVKTLVDTCKGYDLFDPQVSRIHRGKRADTIEECLNLLAHFVPNLMEAAPPDAIVLAPQNYPAPPGGPDQAVGFPVPNLQGSENIQFITITYHIILAQLRRGGAAPGAAPPPAEQFDIPTLVRSALGMTLLMHAVMNAGQMALEIWLPQRAIATNMKALDFVCPKDILCIEDDCGAQKDEFEISSRNEISIRNAFCKKPKYEGCDCKPVSYPHHNLVRPGQVEAQYAWMNYLVKKGEEATNAPKPSFEAKCDGGFQAVKSLAENFKSKIKDLCNTHQTLPGDLSGGMWVNTASDAGQSWQIFFQADANSAKTCPFDCETVFSAFADNKDCVKEDGIMKNGVIKTDCGKAGYVAYALSS